jgi:hypothetical protein
MGSFFVLGVITPIFFDYTDFFVIRALSHWDFFPPSFGVVTNDFPGASSMMSIITPSITKFMTARVTILTHPVLSYKF